MGSEDERKEHNLHQDVLRRVTDELAQDADDDHNVLRSQEQEDGRDPVVDLVGAVEEGEAEGKNRQQEEQERFESCQGGRANEAQPADLVAGGDSTGLAQQGSAVEASGIGLDQWGGGGHPEVEGENRGAVACPSQRGRRQREERRLREVDDGMAGGEVAEAAQQRPIGEELEGVVYVGGACEGELLAGRRTYLDADAVPGVAGVAGMTFGRPAGNVAGYAPDGVVGAGGRGEVDGLPVGVVEGGLGPEGLVGDGVDGRVADGEPPRAVEREDRLAEGDVRDGVGGLDAQRGRVRGIRLLRFMFGSLSVRRKAEKRQQQDRKETSLHSDRARSVHQLDGIDPAPYYSGVSVARGICLSSKRPNGQTNPEAHSLMRICDRNRTLA